MRPLLDTAYELLDWLRWAGCPGLGPERHETVERTRVRLAAELDAWRRAAETTTHVGTAADLADLRTCPTARFERERADEWLARLHDAERARDKAAGVARDLANILRGTCAVMRHEAARVEPSEQSAQLVAVANAHDFACARLLADLAALEASPAPAPDPLAGLPEDVATVVRGAHTSWWDRAECQSVGWAVRRDTSRGTLIVTVGGRHERTVRLAPDGAITREAQP